MAEPRYATESWRWVTSEDGLYRKLLAGPEPLPVPRVVLACGDIDAEDMDLIKAAPDLYAACEDLIVLCEHGDFRNGVTTPMGDVDQGEVYAGRYIDKAHAALAKARGEEVPDA